MKIFAPTLEEDGRGQRENRKYNTEEKQHTNMTAGIDANRSLEEITTYWTP